MIRTLLALLVTAASLSSFAAAAPKKFVKRTPARQQCVETALDSVEDRVKQDLKSLNVNASVKAILGEEDAVNYRMVILAEVGTDGAYAYEVKYSFDTNSTNCSIDKVSQTQFKVLKQLKELEP